mmetsp:Transcript_21287/g.49289  ORF Transcript_21287/g.49289 Transcript_21287/m.49289 type:complete len:92 (+) Transcript_21287:24-299(+)
MLASDWCADAHSCNIASGGISAIVGGFFWFLAAAFLTYSLELSPDRLPRTAVVEEPHDSRVAPEPVIVAMPNEEVKPVLVPADIVVEEGKA